MMTALIPSKSASFKSPNIRLSLLMGQSFSLGVTLGLLVVTSSALFLTEYGSQALPYVYISVAVLGSGLFYGYAELQRRWPLPNLAIITVSITALLFFLAWLILFLTGQRWVSFALLAAYALFFQMGFVILGGQAGRLFDVRQMKRLFPRIVAGFAIGFMVGGFLAFFLSNLIGKTENLLLVAVGSTVSMLLFLILTTRRFREELVEAGSAGPQRVTKSLRQLLTRRFVLLIVAYQMLAAMTTQLMNFILLDQAADRFTESLSFAQFMGNFTVAVNLSDILFLSLIAGFLLSRFGLGLGMVANPIVDGVILVALLIVAAIAGPASGLFFWLVMIARIADITLGDGMRRGSMNTAYQALPANERAPVQTGVEGIGVPVATGLTGVVLLLFEAIGNLTIVHTIVFTLLVVLAWTVSAVLAYRGYAGTLIRTLRRRALAPAELSLDDSSTLATVTNLMQSDKLPEIRLALDLLESAEHQSLEGHLITLAQNPDSHLRVEALARIERLNVKAALPIVVSLIQVEGDGSLKGAALRAHCALAETEAVKGVLPYLENTDRAVRLGAATGLLRYGGIPGVLAAGNHLAGLEKASHQDDRRFVAQVIGDVGSRHFYQPLLKLLADEDPRVRLASLEAAGRVRHPRLVPTIADNLIFPGMRSAAMIALIANDDGLVPYVKQVLTKEVPRDKDDTVRLLRACGQQKGPGAIATLKMFIAHPDRDIRHQVLAALSQCEFRAEETDESLVHQGVMKEIEFAAFILVARQDLGEAREIESLHRALDDEIDRVRKRAFFLLSFTHDPQSIKRAAERLAAGDDAEKALVLETLDVMLARELKDAVLLLVDPKLDRSRRTKQLAGLFSTPEMGLQERLLDIIIDPQNRWPDSWVKVCAIYAAGRLKVEACTDAVEEALSATDATLRETAAWSLYQLDPESFQDHAAKLAADPDPRVSLVVATLSA